MTQLEKTNDSTTKMVNLRNGTQTKFDRVHATYLLVEQLMERDRFTFHQLVSACRNPDHPIDPESRQILIATTLVIEVDPTTRCARISDHTRNMVLSMISGEGICMRLVNPVVF